MSSFERKLEEALINPHKCALCGKDGAAYPKANRVFCDHNCFLDYKEQYTDNTDYVRYRDNDEDRDEDAGQDEY